MTERWELRLTDRPAVPAWTGGGVSPHWPPKRPEDGRDPLRGFLSEFEEALHRADDRAQGREPFAGLDGHPVERRPIPEGAIVVREVEIPLHADNTHIVGLTITPERVQKALDKVELPEGALRPKLVGILEVEVLTVAVGVAMLTEAGPAAMVVEMQGEVQVL